MRQREEETERGERNIDVREEHQLSSFCTHPNQGPNLQPRSVPYRLRTGNLLGCGMMPYQLSHTGWGWGEEVYGVKYTQHKIYHLNHFNCIIQHVKYIHDVVQPFPLSVSRNVSPSPKEILHPYHNYSSFPLITCAGQRKLP